MRASEIRDRSRSLADLKNSQAITYQDEVRSLNESYKEIYNELCRTDYDYNLIDVIITDWDQYVDPNNSKAYIIPLPADFYQLRFVDYMNNGNWQPMSLMKVNQRDLSSSEPLYRLRNSSLWMIIGPNTNRPDQIRVSYYPAPEVITLPDEVISYNLGLEPYKAYTTTNNWYIPPLTDASLNTYSPDVMLYNYDNQLVAESLLNNTQLVLLNQNVTQMEYYRGFIYYLYGGNIYSAPFDPASSTGIASTQIVFLGASITSVVRFNISNNKLYATDDTTSVVANLDGTDSSYFMGTVQYAASIYTVGAYQVYLDATGQLILRGGSIVDPGLPLDGDTYINLASDGQKIFALSSTFNLYNITIKDEELGEKLLIDTDIAYLGGFSGGRLSIVRLNAIGNEAISSDVDFDLSYPSNTLYEIMAYQMAIDYKRKYDANNDDLTKRCNELKSAFLNSMIKQDQYKVERIQNVRQIESNYNWIR